MSEITVNAEKVIKGLEKIEKAIAELRGILAPGVFKKVIPRLEAPKQESDIMTLDLDVSKVPFKIKGGEPARDSNGFAFTFLANREGVVWASNTELANALDQYDKVKIGKFIYQLSKDRARARTVEALDQENFFVLYVHDYDWAGAEMYLTLKKYYDKTYDAGINESFLQYNNIEREKVEEPYRLKKKRQKLIRSVSKFNVESDYDLDYLLGTPIEDTEDREDDAKRIEVDNVEVHYGIEPFVKYIEIYLESIKCWDLRRIDVTDWTLEETDNLYDEALTDYRKSVNQQYDKYVVNASKGLNLVLKTIKNALCLPPEFADLIGKYLGGKTGWDGYYYDKNKKHRRYAIRKVKGDDKVKEKFEEDIDYDWEADYEDEVDALNKQLDCYNGDVREAEGILDEKFDEIEDLRDESKKEDPELVDFSKKLSEIEWGKDELSKLEIPPIKEDVQKAIDALQELLKELEASQ